MYHVYQSSGKNARGGRMVNALEDSERKFLPHSRGELEENSNGAGKERIQEMYPDAGYQKKETRHIPEEFPVSPPQANNEDSCLLEKKKGCSMQLSGKTTSDFLVVKRKMAVSSSDLDVCAEEMPPDEFPITTTEEVASRSKFDEENLEEKAANDENNSCLLEKKQGYTTMQWSGKTTSEFLVEKRKVGVPYDPDVFAEEISSEEFPITTIEEAISSSKFDKEKLERNAEGKHRHHNHHHKHHHKHHPEPSIHLHESVGVESLDPYRHDKGYHKHNQEPLAHRHDSSGLVERLNRSRRDNDPLPSGEEHVSSEEEHHGAYAWYPDGRVAPRISSPDDSDLSRSTSQFRDQTINNQGGPSAPSSATQPTEPLTSHDEGLIEAHLVDEDMDEVVKAKPDPWWRRNQWWLTGAIVAMIVGVVLSVVLTVVDLKPQVSEPTIAPTSALQGKTAVVRELIVSTFPIGEVALSNESSPQYQALLWISTESLGKTTSYTDAKVLQRYSLATLFYSMNTSSRGTSWNVSDGWLTPTNVCEWHGVLCQQDSQLVESLNFSNNTLVGLVPPELALLSNSLISVEFSHNHLNGGLPPEIGELALLSALEIANNEMTGTIPSEVGRLVNLRILSLKENQMRGSIPFEVGSMSNLEIIDCKANAMTGLIPSSIGMLSSLRSLIVLENTITGSIPSEIGTMSSLEHIDISDNDLSASIPTEIGKLTRLKDLIFDRNGRLDNIIPTQVGLISTLQILRISETNLRSTLPTEIGKLRNLQFLGLLGNRLTGSIPSEIGLLTSLSMFALCCNPLRGSIPSEIGMLTRLQYIFLSEASLVGSIPTQIESLSSLVYLTLAVNYLRGPFPSVIGRLANLQVLSLFTNRLTGLIPSEIGALSDLTELGLSNNRITGSIPSEVGMMKNLSDLDLSQNSLKGAIPEEVTMLSNLKDMKFDDNMLTGTIPTGIGPLANLERLALSQNRLTGSIPSEVGALSNLVELNLFGNAIAGSIPAEIGYISKLEKLQLHRNALTGRIPLEVGLLSSTLMIFMLYENLLTGEIPSVFGMLTGLEEMYIYSNPVGGSIPSEIGNLSNLLWLDVHSNLLTQSIPSEIGRLSSLQSLHLMDNLFTSSIPPEIGLLTNLKDLRMNFNFLLVGSIPEALCTLEGVKIEVDIENVACSCCNGWVTVTLVVQLDASPEDLMWRLVRSSDGTTVATGGIVSPYNSPSDEVIETFLLHEDENYAFTITDLGSDGLCCEYGLGYYRFYLGSEKQDDLVLVCGDGDFGPSATHNFRPVEDFLTACATGTMDPPIPPPANQNATCTLCFGGDYPPQPHAIYDLSHQINETCAEVYEILNAIQEPAEEELCEVIQATAYLTCNCPLAPPYPENPTCSICPHEAFPPNPKPVCEDVNTIVAILFDVEECHAAQQELADYGASCGCNMTTTSQ